MGESRCDGKDGLPSMRILVTGDKGFIGSNLRVALEADGHEVVGLEVKSTFKEWYDEIYTIMDTPIEAVAHLGANSNNQSKDPYIFLWNSYATFLLAQRVRQKMNSMSPMPFVFLSAFLVDNTSDDWESRTPYSWSKALAEHFTQVYLPDATIIRPAMVWGDERDKPTELQSHIFKLASHTLKYLYRNWSRYCVHVDDVVKGIKDSLIYKHKGIFCLSEPAAWTNEELAALIDWEDYKWVDDPKKVGHQHILHHAPAWHSTPLPGWKAKKLVRTELRRLERELNG